jgi:hypothetical protein
MFSSPYRSDRLWVPPSLLCNGDSEILIWWALKISTHLHAVQNSRERRSIHPLPHTSSLRSASLVEDWDNFTFYYSRWFVCFFVYINIYKANFTLRITGFLLFPPSAILKTQMNTMFRKLDLFPSSNEGCETPIPLDVKRN